MRILEIIGGSVKFLQFFLMFSEGGADYRGGGYGVNDTESTLDT